jgi:hypothetical protein
VLLHAEGAAAGIAVDLDLAVGLEAGGAVDGQELDGAFLFDAGQRAGVDAAGWRDEIVHRQVDRDAGDIQQRVADAVAGQGVVHDPRVHFVVGGDDAVDFGIEAPVGRPARRVRGLLGDVVDEDITVALHRPRQPAGAVGDGAEPGGGGDGDGAAGVEGAGGGGGLGAIGGVTDERLRGGAAQMVSSKAAS